MPSSVKPPPRYASHSITRCYTPFIRSDWLILFPIPPPVLLHCYGTMLNSCHTVVDVRPLLSRVQNTCVVYSSDHLLLYSPFTPPCRMHCSERQARVTIPPSPLLTTCSIDWLRSDAFHITMFCPSTTLTHILLSPYWFPLSDLWLRSLTRDDVRPVLTANSPIHDWSMLFRLCAPTLFCFVASPDCYAPRLHYWLYTPVSTYCACGVLLAKFLLLSSSPFDWQVYSRRQFSSHTRLTI